MSDRTRIHEHSLKINVQKYIDSRPIFSSLKRTLGMKLLSSFKGTLLPPRFKTGLGQVLCFSNWPCSSHHFNLYTIPLCLSLALKWKLNRLEIDLTFGLVVLHHRLISCRYHRSYIII